MKIPNFLNIRFKIGKTWLVIIIIILIIIGYFFIKGIFKSPTDGLLTEKITKGLVLQEVSETGSVRATENISLGFKSVGKVAKIDVAVGDSVKKGDVLAELDFSQVAAQLQSAKAVLNSANTQYDKLINGLTPQDVKTYEDAVTSAQQDLNNTYDGALNTLNDAYLDIYNAYNVVVSIRNSYFSASDQSGIVVSSARDDINSNMQDVKNYLDAATKSSTKSDIDSAVSRMLIVLNNVYNDLKIVREQCDQGIYYSKVSAADKTSLDTQKANINTASTTVTTLQNSISSYEVVLQKAEDNLSSKTASARPEDIDIYKADINQAQANVNALQNQLNDNYLVSSIDGIVTEVNIKKGQIISPSQSAINLLSTEPFQIKVAIYEQDIVSVKIGNDVKINLVAFPKQTFNGKVLSIDPAETIIDNVVYYQVTIEFPNQPEGIRSGMTADIVIEANKKDNVLRIPKNAVLQTDGTQTVQVVRPGARPKIENVVITTGLEGNNYFEVISGLNEGDQIVTGKS